jgi:hypothetical protein
MSAHCTDSQESIHPDLITSKTAKNCLLPQVSDLVDNVFFSFTQVKSHVAMSESPTRRLDLDGIVVGQLITSLCLMDRPVICRFGRIWMILDDEAVKILTMHMIADVDDKFC